MTEMSDGRCAPRTLGLALVAAIAAMAFVASAAQADPEYYIGKLPEVFKLAGLNLVSGLTEGKTVPTGGWELLIPGIGVRIFCQHQKSEGWIKNQVLTGSKIGDGIGLGTVEFKKCEVLNDPTCVVKEPISSTVRTELILHEVSGKKEPYVLFTPDNAENTFAKIFITGEECLLALLSPLTIEGSIAGEALLGDKLKEEIHFNDTVYKLICGKTSEGGLAKCAFFTFGNEPMTLDGLAFLELLNGNQAEGYEQNAGKEWQVK